MASAWQLWPREHGATTQLLVPLASVPLVAGVLSWRYAVFVLAAVAAFIAHEPLLVLAGRRGERRRRELDGSARRVLPLLAAIAAGAGMAALFDASLAVWIATGVTALLGAASAWLALRGRERNLGGELLAALALVSIAAPAALLSGCAVSRSLWITGTWALAFGLGTVCARTILVRKKDGGLGLRLAGLFAAVVFGSLVALVATSLVGAWVAAGPLAFAALTLVLSLRPPPAKHMTRLGVGLVGASVVTLVGLVVGLD